MVEEGYFYFLKDSYLEKHKDSVLMDTKKLNGNKRPFFCVNDPERPAIKWMIPLSSNIDKYMKKASKLKKSADSQILFYPTSVTSKSAFLLQNACPCLATDIEEKYYHNDKPVTLPPNANKYISQTMKRYAHIILNNIPVGYISNQTVKEVIREYIQTMQVTSKDVASIGKEIIRKEKDPTALKGLIMKKEGKLYEIKKACVNKNKENINLTIQRDGATKEYENVIFRNDIKLEDKRDIISKSIMIEEMEMD